VGAPDYGPHTLQIHPETPVGHVVGVTDSVTELRSLATNITSLRHVILLGMGMGPREASSLAVSAPAIKSPAGSLPQDSPRQIVRLAHFAQARCGLLGGQVALRFACQLEADQKLPDRR
jgi:hypothetical protein